MVSAPVLLTVLALLFFGGKVLSGFSIAMLWGLFVGTFSSIRVGMPVLLYLDLRSGDALVGGGKDAAEPEPEPAPGTAPVTVISSSGTACCAKAGNDAEDINRIRRRRICMGPSQFLWPVLTKFGSFGVRLHLCDRTKRL